MGIAVSIAGMSGSGKTRSIGQMDLDSTFVIRVNKKPFSFKEPNRFKKWDKDKKKGHYMYSNDYSVIQSVLKVLPKYGKKSIIIDDSTHLMTDEFMREVNTKGYDKFSTMAVNYYDLIKSIEDLDEDVVVYIINHIEYDALGNPKIKTIGKMLDEKVDIPSLLTVSINSIQTTDGYKFKTCGDTNEFFKTPEGMFAEKFIDNDLSVVDKAIREFYGI